MRVKKLCTFSFSDKKQRSHTPSYLSGRLQINISFHFAKSRTIDTEWWRWLDMSKYMQKIWKLKLDVILWKGTLSASNFLTTFTDICTTILHSVNLSAKKYLKSFFRAPHSFYRHAPLITLNFFNVIHSTKWVARYKLQLSTSTAIFFNLVYLSNEDCQNVKCISMHPQSACQKLFVRIV